MRNKKNTGLCHEHAAPLPVTCDGFKKPYTLHSPASCTFLRTGMPSGRTIHISWLLAATHVRAFAVLFWAQSHGDEAQRHDTAGGKKVADFTSHYGHYRSRGIFNATYNPTAIKVTAWPFEQQTKSAEEALLLLLIQIQWLIRKEETTQDQEVTAWQHRKRDQRQRSTEIEAEAGKSFQIREYDWWHICFCIFAQSVFVKYFTGENKKNNVSISPSSLFPGTAAALARSLTSSRHVLGGEERWRCTFFTHNGRARQRLSPQQRPRKWRLHVTTHHRQQIRGSRSKRLRRVTAVNTPSIRLQCTPIAGHWVNEGENCELRRRDWDVLADLGALACLNKANGNKEQACSRTPRDENTKCGARKTSLVSNIQTWPYGLDDFWWVDSSSDYTAVGVIKWGRDWLV